MMPDEAVIDSGPLGGCWFCIQLALVLAKVLGIVHWSWFWIFTPIWLPAALVCLWLLGLLILGTFFFRERDE
jgi:membrane protein YdbS with pleckstrin-like domain